MSNLEERNKELESKIIKALYYLKLVEKVDKEYLIKLLGGKQ